MESAIFRGQIVLAGFKFISIQVFELVFVAFVLSKCIHIHRRISFHYKLFIKSSWMRWIYVCECECVSLFVVKLPMQLNDR